MKIIVGLGNPGKKYKNTRHNMGYSVVEKVASRYQIEKEESKYDSIIGHLRIEQEKVLIVKPLTYMNMSGKAVQPLVRFYKVKFSDLLVIYDDVDLEAGRMRIRANGGTGGHKGIASIIESLGTKEFPRIRIGIGRPLGVWEVRDWVLSELNPAEKIITEESIQHASDAAVNWVKNGIVHAMNKYN